MMRKLIIGSLLILSLILMAGCGINYVKSAPTAPVAAETPAVVETTPPPPPAPVVVQNTSCKDNADCTGVLQCTLLHSIKLIVIKNVIIIRLKLLLAMVNLLL
ncbi:hypothetical protein J4444_03970 [Candidatus Woesearchaeota archaeon]|nr:hypothetical protein [Candidatus Woesearchaeota archaeon]